MKRNVWHTFRRNPQPPWRWTPICSHAYFKFLSIYTAFRPGGYYFCYWQCHVNKIFFPISDSFAQTAELSKNSTAQFTLVCWVPKLDSGEEQGNVPSWSYTAGSYIGGNCHPLLVLGQTVPYIGLLTSSELCECLLHCYWPLGEHILWVCAGI